MWLIFPVFPHDTVSWSLAIGIKSVFSAAVWYMDECAVLVPCKTGALAMVSLKPSSRSGQFWASALTLSMPREQRVDFFIWSWTLSLTAVSWHMSSRCCNVNYAFGNNQYWLLPFVVTGKLHQLTKGVVKVCLEKLLVLSFKK